MLPETIINERKKTCHHNKNRLNPNLNLNQPGKNGNNKKRPTQKTKYIYGKYFIWRFIWWIVVIFFIVLTPSGIHFHFHNFHNITTEAFRKKHKAVWPSTGSIASNPHQFKRKLCKYGQMYLRKIYIQVYWNELEWMQNGFKWTVCRDLHNCGLELVNFLNAILGKLSVASQPWN